MWVALGCQISDSNQIVGRCRKGEDRIDPVAAAMMKLAERLDGFELPENFFDPFSNAQADAISFMAGCTAING